MNMISKITAATAFAAATAAATLIAATACASTASANPFEELFGLHREQVQAPAYQSQGDDGSQDEARSQDEAPTSSAARSSTIATSEAPGTIIIDTPNTYLYLVMRQRQGDALRHRRRPRRLHLVGRRRPSPARRSGRTGRRRRR